MNDALNEAATPDPGALAAALAQEHAADIVERLNAESPETSSAVLLALPLERAAEVLDEPGLENAAALVELQPRERAVALLKAMSADRAADVFRRLEPAAREPLLAKLDPETRIARPTARLSRKHSAQHYDDGVRERAVDVDHWRNPATHQQSRTHPRDDLRHLRGRSEDEGP